jgi:hypothetical protein
LRISDCGLAGSRHPLWPCLLRRSSRLGCEGWTPGGRRALPTRRMPPWLGAVATAGGPGLRSVREGGLSASAARNLPCLPAGRPTAPWHGYAPCRGRRPPAVTGRQAHAVRAPHLPLVTLPRRPCCGARGPRDGPRQAYPNPRHETDEVAHHLLRKGNTPSAEANTTSNPLLKTPYDAGTKPAARSTLSEGNVVDINGTCSDPGQNRVRRPASQAWLRDWRVRRALGTGFASPVARARTVFRGEGGGRSCGRSSRK